MSDIINPRLVSLQFVANAGLAATKIWQKADQEHNIPKAIHFKLISQRGIEYLKKNS